MSAVFWLLSSDLCHGGPLRDAQKQLRRSVPCGFITWPKNNSAEQSDSNALMLSTEGDTQQGLEVAFVKSSTLVLRQHLNSVADSAN